MKSFVFGFLILILVSGSALVSGGYFFLTLPGAGTGEESLFQVEKGNSFGLVVKRLEQDNLIKHGILLRAYARFTGSHKNVKIGEYALNDSMRPLEILKIISSGQSVQYSISFKEGLNRYEMADLFEQYKLASREEFLQLTEDQKFIKELLGKNLPSLEGYLFPSTYYYTKFTNARELIRKMIDEFNKNTSDIQLSNTARVPLTREELVILASIIEKETGAEVERPMISSVFHNRLAKGMRLQTDPTVIYGVWLETGEPLKNIKKVHLITRTPYNTYKISGLPPGPIANPGRESLLAAANPIESSYLYFVSRNDGTHIFTETYEKHAKAVREYQLRKKKK